MKKTVGLANTGFIVSVLLQSQFSYDCMAGDGVIPKFKECISESNVIIKGSKDKIKICNGRSNYTITEKGLLGENTGDIKVSQSNIGSFDVSLFNGIINFRASRNNGIWHLMMFNTNYSGNLAIKADYVDLYNAITNELVVCARKDQIKNSGDLRAKNIKMLSHFIYNEGSIKASNSTDSSSFADSNHRTTTLSEKDRKKLSHVFNKSSREFEDKTKRRPKGFWNKGELAAYDVVAKDLAETALGGTVGVNKITSDDKIAIGYIPSTKQTLNYDITIREELNAPSVSLPLRFNEQNKRITCNDAPNNKLSITNCNAKINVNALDADKVIKVLGEKFIDKKAKFDSDAKINGAISRIPSILKNCNSECKNAIVREIKKEAAKISLSNYDTVNKVKNSIANKKKELARQLGVDSNIDSEKFLQEIDGLRTLANQKFLHINSENPNNVINNINRSLRLLGIRDYVVTRENAVILMKRVEREILSIRNEIARSEDINYIVTWYGVRNPRTLETKDDLLGWVAEIRRSDGIAFDTNVQRLDRVMTLIDKIENWCNLWTEVSKLGQITLDSLEKAKKTIEDMENISPLIQIFKEIGVVKFLSESSHEPFVLLDVDSVYRGRLEGLNGTPCSDKAICFSLVKDKVDISEKDEFSNKYPKIPLSLFNLIKNVVKALEKNNNTLQMSQVNGLINSIEGMNLNNETVPDLRKLISKLNYVKDPWAVISKRLIETKISFKDLDANTRKLYYKVVLSEFIESSSQPICFKTKTESNYQSISIEIDPNSRSVDAKRPLKGVNSNSNNQDNKNERIKTVFSNFCKVFRDLWGISGFLHDLSNEDAEKLAKITGGDLRLMIYYGNLLKYNNRQIVLPEFLTYLFMDRGEYDTLTAEHLGDDMEFHPPIRYVKKDINGDNLFRRLIGDNYTDLQVNASNGYFSRIFIKMLGIVFRKNSSQYTSIQDVMADLSNDQKLFSSCDAHFTTPLYDVIDDSEDGVKKGILGSFSSLFYTNDYQNQYGLFPAWQSTGGILNDMFESNRIMYLFDRFDKLVNEYNNLNQDNHSRKAEIEEVISTICGHLMQGFHHCAAGKNRAVQEALNIVLGQSNAIPDEVNEADLLQLSIFSHCQKIVSSLFRFMEWKFSYYDANGERVDPRKFRYVGGDVYGIESSSLQEIGEETMSIAYIFQTLDGAYGLHKETQMTTGTQSWTNFQLYLLSQIYVNPYVTKGLEILWNSNDETIKSFGADVTEGKCGDNLRKIGYLDPINNEPVIRANGEIFVPSENDPIGQNDRWYFRESGDAMTEYIYQKLIKTMLFGCMNDTSEVINGISEGAFTGKIIEFFDKKQHSENKGKWRDFQTLLNYYLDETDIEGQSSTKDDLKNRFMIYRLTKANLLQNQAVTVGEVISYRSRDYYFGW